MVETRNQPYNVQILLDEVGLLTCQEIPFRTRENKDSGTKKQGGLLTKDQQISKHPECISFIFWEKLRLNNFVSRLIELYQLLPILFSKQSSTKYWSMGGQRHTTESNLSSSTAIRLQDRFIVSSIKPKFDDLFFVDLPGLYNS